MTTTETRDKYAGARDNAKGWYKEIKELIDRLGGHEKAAKEAGWEPFTDKFGVACWKDTADGATWAGTAKDLCEAFHIDAEQDEEALLEIHDGPLSVLVRDGWRTPGGVVGPNPEPPEKFELLLSTGGPALRIYGTLSADGAPEDCELQMQDWGVPWAKWVPEPYDQEYRDVLLAYAACFYFGD